MEGGKFYEGGAARRIDDVLYMSISCIGRHFFAFRFLIAKVPHHAASDKLRGTYLSKRCKAKTFYQAYVVWRGSCHSSQVSYRKFYGHTPGRHYGKTDYFKADRELLIKKMRKLKHHVSVPFPEKMVYDRKE